MIVKLLTEHHLEFLSLKGGCRGSSESTLVKMSNCWKSHAAAHLSTTHRATVYMLKLVTKKQAIQSVKVVSILLLRYCILYIPLKYGTTRSIKP